MDRKYVLCSFLYAIAGLALGIVMAASKNHGELVTHAHIMLVGFVISFVYGLCHKLWLNNVNSPLAKAQFIIHQLGAVVMSVGLFLLYGNHVAIEKIDPILAMSSIAVFVGMVLMVVLFLKSCKST